MWGEQWVLALQAGCGCCSEPRVGRQVCMQGWVLSGLRRVPWSDLSAGNRKRVKQGDQQRDIQKRKKEEQHWWRKEWGWWDRSWWQKWQRACTLQGQLQRLLWVDSNLCRVWSTLGERATDGKALRNWAVEPKRAVELEVWLDVGQPQSSNCEILKQCQKPTKRGKWSGGGAWAWESVPLSLFCLQPSHQQGGLACCSPRGRKESDFARSWLSYWTELNFSPTLVKPNQRTKVSECHNQQMSGLRSPGWELRSPALGASGQRRVEGGSGGAKNWTA